MEKERTEVIRERVLSLISSEFESDAAFERAMNLSEKNSKQLAKMPLGILYENATRAFGFVLGKCRRAFGYALAQ